MMRYGMIMIVGCAVSLSGCGPKAEHEAGSPPGAIFSNALVPATPPAADGWVGRWTGPEGLFLDIARDSATAGRYALTIKADLDSAGDHYVGNAVDGGIRFTRKNAEETIRPGRGTDTGFKWLTDKKDCLIVVPSKEGYCRD